MANLLSLIGQLFQKHQAANSDVSQASPSPPSSPSFGQRLGGFFEGGREGGIMGAIDGVRGMQQARSPPTGAPRPVLKPRPVPPQQDTAPPADPGAPPPVASAPMINGLDTLDFLNKIKGRRAPLPDLPTYTPHDKHGFGERVIGFFKGGRQGGLGAALEGAIHPETGEYQQFVQNKLYPALMQRKMLGDEQDAEMKAALEVLKGISGYNKEEQIAALNTRKQNWAENKPVSVPEGSTLVTPLGKVLLKSQKPAHIDTSTEYAQIWNAEKGKYEPLLDDEEKPLLSRQVKEEMLRQQGQTNRLTYAQGQQNARTHFVQGETNKRAAMQEAGRNRRSGLKKNGQPVMGRKVFDEDDIEDMIKNDPEVKGLTAEEVRHQLEMRGLRFKPKPTP